MSALPVDIDAETIQFEGHWMTREELAKAVRQLLDAGNYNISRHSAALEALSNALTEVSTVQFRASSALAEQLAEAAAQAGKTPGHLIRDALAAYLSTGDWGMAAAVPVSHSREPEGRRQTTEVPIVSDEPEPAPAPAPQQFTFAPPSSPPPGLRPAHAVIPGPGALRAAGVAEPVRAEVVTEDASPEDAAHAVDLTPKSKGAEAEQAEAVERRWFGN